MPDVTKAQTVKTDSAVDAIAPPKADAAPESGAPKAAQSKPRGLWGDAWYDLRHRPMFWISASLLVLLLVIAAFPGLFTSADPRAGDLTNHYLTKPELGKIFSPEWFGYDIQGRSIYARVVYGTRASILVGVGVTLAITVFGGLMGMLVRLLRRLARLDHLPCHRHLLRHPLPARRDGRSERLHRAQGVRRDPRSGLPRLDLDLPRDARAPSSRRSRRTM